MPYSLSARHGNAIRVRKMMQHVTTAQYNTLTIDLPWVKPKDVSIPWGMVIEATYSRIIQRLPITNLLLAEKPPPRYVERAAAMLRHVDVVQAENLWAMGAAQKLDKKGGIGTFHDVYSDRMSELLDHFKTPLTRKREILRRTMDLEQRVMGNLDATVFVSQADFERYRQLGVDPPKPHIIPNGVDTKLFRPIPRDEGIHKKYGLPSNKKIILFSGSDMYQNRDSVEYFLAIASELIRKGESVHPVVSGEICNYAKKVMGKFNVKASLLGWVEDLAEVYSASDVYIAPIFSGTGTKLKILEALACAKPLITTSKGAAGLPKDGAYLVGDNLDELSELTQQVLDDNELSTRLAENARNLALQYEWGKIMSDYQRVYELV